VTISNRLFLGFGIIIILMVGIGLFGVSQVSRVRDTMDRVVERDFAMISELNTIFEAQAEATAATQDAVRLGLGGNPPIADIDKAEQTYRDSIARMQEAVRRGIILTDQYSSTALSAERANGWKRNSELLREIDNLLKTSSPQREEQFRAIRAGQTISTAFIEASMAQRRSQFLTLIGEMRDVANGGIEAGRVRVRQVYDESQISTIGAIIAAVIVAIVIVLLLRRAIVGPIQKFMLFVERVGRGELSGQPAVVGADEIGRLGVTLNSMVAGLKELAQQNREATNNLGSAIAEIRASTQEQAAGVEEQLAAVQETAATVDEITHAGSQVTKRAQEVIASAQATAQTSADGMRAVDETSRAMDGIREQAELVAQNIVSLSEKTQAIGDIISSVNDISERSHLLALNAAIEAAAAGENGRSFAVVASEMKVLADQAKDATNQVRGILSDVQRGINTSVMLTEESVKRAAAGKQRTEISQRTIGEITNRFQESVLTFQQIVASTNQQQLGIEQVMGALQNIRQASQQTAAGTRQLNDAASNLGSLSEQLLGLSARYRL
jgi:methyl-accepting chemotaxis protein